MKKTIYDIAREAGVGTATVSRVINNSGYVSEATRAKVESILSTCELHGKSKQNRNVASSKIKAIGLSISHDPTYFFINSTYWNAMLGISVVTQEFGYKLVLDISNNETEILTLFESRMIDGIILMGAKSNSKIIETLIERQYPFVLIGDYSPQTEPFCTIEINDREMAKEATEHLISLGHTRIGYLSGSFEHASCQNRYQGYMDALCGANIEPNPNYFASCSSITEDKAYHLALKLLYQTERVSAILAFNDTVAIAVYKAAKEVGLVIPDDLSVIGFDDSVLAQIATPALTTVWQPSYEKGCEAASILIKSFDDPALRKKSVNLNGVLVFRNSCMALSRPEWSGGR